MPVFDQGYRAYTGPVRRGSRALAIAWESIRPRFRWYVWLLVPTFTFWPHVVLAVMVWIVSMAGGTTGGVPVTPSDVAFEPTIGLDPRDLVGLFQAHTTSFYWNVLFAAGTVGGFVLLPAIACAGILAADRRTGALQIYLARPVTRGDYVVGKLLATAAFPALVTAVPTLLLWGEACLLRPDPAFIFGTWTAPFSIVFASTIWSFWGAALVMAMSSVIARPVLAGIAAVFAHMFLSGLAGALSDVFDDRVWLSFSPVFALGATTAPFFGLSLPDWLSPAGCALQAFAFPALCLLLVVRRVRAVEVAT